jgi:flavin-dependent dehydrogenase
VVRKRVIALPNVEVIEGCDVLGLTHTADNSRITGVRLIRRQVEAPEETLTADLVVDAGGRGSRAPAWLESLGYDRPEKEEIRVNMGYTTCYFRRQPDHMPGINAIVVAPNLPGKVGGVIIAQEDNRWVVTLFGYSGHHAPLDLQEFLEFARNLPTPDIYNIIKDAELLGEAAAYKFPANLRQRYEKLARFPERYLVIGDALCSFNPIYGQGMTVAATEAEALGECLANGDSQLAKRFFNQASKIIDTPWRSAAGNDLRNPEVEGSRTPMVRFINWYIDRLHIAAQQDAEVSIAFLKVINMLAPPPTVMHPRIAWRVLRANLRPGKRETTGNTLLTSQPAIPHPSSVRN